ncbi:heptaprenylglyceryl phosphate synthase [Paenibacillus sp.]|uniref:heptaprenylglyceryl phosphate synthase n=1 Tax=Paenibacillus sp. TaxID=58172 RepID=UPI002812782D|nr:heptaprenylglyceryl phosphate synthase [Paenibacillus sp.]
MVERIVEEWKHVFKLDPEKRIGDEALEALCLSGTDAIMVGGSSGVTYDDTVDLLSRLRRYELPCALEVTTLDAVVPGFDAYLIPVALNAGDPNYLIGHHIEALKRYGSLLPKEGTIAAEGYVIANPDCEAARVAGAKPVDEADIVAYARFADRLLRLPIVYIEYSGAFGDMEAVARARAALTNGARLFYGGGIDGAEKAAAAARAADTIVVGNIIYQSLARALDTVRVVQS